MGPKINKNVESNKPSDSKIDDSNKSAEPIKAKRGRKSKKELMESLNMVATDSKSPEKPNTILNISETLSHSTDSNIIPTTNIYSEVLENKNDDTFSNDENENDDNQNSENTIVIICKPGVDKEELKPATKKRGRKPKGGKIIQHIVSNEQQKEDKPNVILHLKCAMKDLQNHNQTDCAVESYNFASGCKNELTYNIIENENSSTFNDKNSSSISNLDNYNVEADSDDEIMSKDISKDIWKKLKQLEHNLHINNVNNKRSACFWDTCEFHNPPIYIPKHFINGTYHVYGCFCSPECGVAYLMNENIDSSTKFERYHMFNHIYTKIYDYKKNIKPAPNPYYMLEKYYGNLLIQDYRSLLRNERLFLIVDKPLTRILPELHEDNDDFILNNKIIPSNNYNIKTKLQKKKQNKSLIVNEKFGIVNQTGFE